MRGALLGLDVVEDDDDEAIRAWRRRGVRVATVSSPDDPDDWIRVTRSLDVPVEHCVGFHDTERGVEAMLAAHLGRAVGVRRTGTLRPLWETGADAVVRTLYEVQSRAAHELPDALSGLRACLCGSRPVLLLDYDGTLTPIVDDPDAAVLHDDMRDALARAARVLPLAVISGRGLDDVRSKVGLDGLWYAGSHGFELLDPEGHRSTRPAGEAALPDLDAATESLEAELGGVSGVHVERKPFAIAVHYRRAPEAEDRVVGLVAVEAARHQHLRATRGKAIAELRPAGRWDKGRAVDALLEPLGPGVPVYVGDDTTDEDAFWALLGRGVGVLVGDHGAETAAHLRLEGPDGVRQLLERYSES